MVKIQNQFKRYEIKYLLDARQYESVRRTMQGARSVTNTGKAPSAIFITTHPTGGLYAARSKSRYIRKKCGCAATGLRTETTGFFLN